MAKSKPEGPVQGGGDTDALRQAETLSPPEPDVLERGKVYFDEHFTEEGPIPRELCSDVEQLLADAIAEIKCERAEHAECCETLAKMDGQLVRAAQQLRAITEAEPVAWEVWVGRVYVTLVKKKDEVIGPNASEATFIPLYTRPRKEKDPECPTKE